MELKTKLYLLSAIYIDYDFDSDDNEVYFHGPVNIISPDFAFLENEFRGLVHTVCEQCVAFVKFGNVGELYDETQIYLPSFDSYWNSPQDKSFLSYLINDISNIFEDPDIRISLLSNHQIDSRAFFCSARIPGHKIGKFKINISPQNILTKLPDRSVVHMGGMFIPDFSNKEIEAVSIQTLWKRTVPYGYDSTT